MKTASILLSFALASTCLSLGQHQTSNLDEPIVGGTLPYSIEIREVSLTPAALPNLHSAAAAIWEGQWVLLAGRTNGLHGMTGMNAFDPSFENREVWVIDPVARQSWSKSFESASAGLTNYQIDILSAVNTQFYQDGERLLIAGGYGYSREASDHRTYPTLSAIDLPGLIAWVKAPPGAETTLAADHIEQVDDAFFQVTGGALERIGDEFQLVFGQNYYGRYRPNFNGTYTKNVRRFKTSSPGESFAVLPGSKLQTATDDAYRRRDLNIAPMLEFHGDSGEIHEAVAALSGVFTPSDGVWTAPVIVRAAGDVQMSDPLVAETLQQAFQIYHCAKIGLFHRATGEMHFVLFGGITVLDYDTDSGTWIRDDNAPFTNSCGVVVRHSGDRFEQYLLPARFPTILSDGKALRFGANAEFLAEPSVAALERHVLDLAAIDRRMVIGHIFGGLISDAGNGGNTGSSGRVFEVALVPIAPAAPTLTIAAAGGGIQLGVPGQTGISYLLEESTELLTWSAVSPPVAGDGSQLFWSLPKYEGRRFYRVLAGTQSHP